MSQQNIYESIKHIIHISTNIKKGCEHCEENLFKADLAETVNHYIEKHNYKLLHVGSEADLDQEGKTCHHTIAVLGK